jgi:hypothetical protein
MNVARRSRWLLFSVWPEFDSAAGWGTACSLARLFGVESSRLLHVLHLKGEIFHAQCRNAMHRGACALA